MTNMIEIRDIFGAVLYSASVSTLTEAVLAAARAGISLWRANLRGADLGGADLGGADLGGADLGGADLRGADLRGANLRGADLGGADLRGADLGGADLGGADLGGADLGGADLGGADLGGADLGGADLRGADLGGADLRGADLGGADLGGADLRGANLRGADLGGANLGETTKIDLECAKSIKQIVPEAGAFVAYKKVHGPSGRLVLKLQIPEDAGRVGGIVGRKCRAQKATVLAAYSLDGEELQDFTGECYSTHKYDFKYRVGQEVVPDSWDPNPLKECTHGIHFFITFREAADY